MNIVTAADEYTRAQQLRNQILDRCNKIEKSIQEAEETLKKMGFTNGEDIEEFIAATPKAIDDLRQAASAELDNLSKTMQEITDALDGNTGTS